ncbi:hypothetical protein MBCUT_15360 [Methanobrevibacter cuticularis]|uniref:Uncharacterized protein n=1 Tax=Methanobrevibacter cuticularis TaxID=47311 RepID=A0A166DCN0_9EURY|nr:hypothetical protein [Methanobrevibacter cuticularis]KZX15448.1 hypothetical protein MBCUT_15360 [Methanobrevibacter cuticularis]
MDAMELLAILILAGAVIILLYYYIQNNAVAADKIRTYIPSIANNGNESEQMPSGGVTMDENTTNSSVGEKIKVKFKDIDMPNFNTDSFSKKIDAFLDSKSDDLIKDWSLATKNDISDLEKRWDSVKLDINQLEKRFNEYRDYTNERIDKIDERLKKIEEE